MAFAPIFQRPFSATFDRRAAVAAAPAVNFFLQAYTGSRNNYTGDIGYVFTPAGSITVRALGRQVSIAIASNHTVALYRNDATPVLLASVVVSPSSVQDGYGYAYELLVSPVVLSSGTNYRLLSSEASGGDKWRDVGAVPNHSAVASILGAAIAPTTNSYSGGADAAYVPPTFFT